MNGWLKPKAAGPAAAVTLPEPAPLEALPLLEAVLQAATEGMVAVRARDGVIVSLNAAAERLLQQPSARALGRLLEDVAPGLNGQVRWRDVPAGRETYRIGVLKGAAEQEAVQQVLQEKAAAMQLLQAVTMAANDASRAEDAALFALERLCQYGRWPLGHLFLLSPDASRELLPTTQWYLKEPQQFQAFQSATAALRLQPGEDLPGAALISGRPECWSRLPARAEFLRREAAQACGLQIGCAIPVLAGSRIVGVLELYTNDAHARTDMLLEIAGPLGMQLGRVYERVEAQREHERKSQMLARNETAILNILSDLKQSHDELQAAQLQLIQAAKLESVGRLAAGVAHEVKNPLAIILMGVAYLAKQPVLKDNAKLLDVLTDIHDAVVRADGVIKGLLEFSASRGLARAPQDPVDVIQKALALVKHELVKANVAAMAELEDHLPLVPMDRTKLEQVLVNLFINAVHAMPKGGTLTVRACRRQLTEVGAGVGQRQTDRFRVGQTVLAVEVDDTGTGIPMDKVGKVFDPFFTTKPPGQGTGLGLSVTRNIVELHAGTITIANRPEGGVRVTLLLPLNAEGGSDAAA